MCVCVCVVAKKKRGCFVRSLKIVVIYTGPCQWAMSLSSIVCPIPPPPPPFPLHCPAHMQKTKNSRSEKGLVAQSKISFLCRNRCVAQSKKRGEHLKVSGMLSGLALVVDCAWGGGGCGGSWGGGADLDEYLWLCQCPGEFAGERDGLGSAGWESEAGGVFEWSSCYGWDRGDAGPCALGEDGNGEEKEGKDWEDEVLHFFDWCGLVGGGRKARYSRRMEVWGLRGKAKSVNVDGQSEWTGAFVDEQNVGRVERSLRSEVRKEEFE